MSRIHIEQPGPFAPQAGAWNRRNFLRGMGACIALPALESLWPARARAVGAVGKVATTATGAPLRTAFVYFPNGTIPSGWWPKSEGDAFELNRTMQPLEALRQHLQILGGCLGACKSAVPAAPALPARPTRLRCDPAS